MEPNLARRRCQRVSLDRSKPRSDGPRIDLGVAVSISDGGYSAGLSPKIV